MAACGLYASPTAYASAVQNKRKYNLERGGSAVTNSWNQQSGASKQRFGENQRLQENSMREWQIAAWNAGEKKLESPFDYDHTRHFSKNP